MLAGKISLAAAIGCVLVLSGQRSGFSNLLGLAAKGFDRDWICGALVGVGRCRASLGHWTSARDNHPFANRPHPDRGHQFRYAVANMVCDLAPFGIGFGPLPDLLNGAILQLVNAPIVLAMAAYLVVADPETWAQDTAENRQRLQERMKAGLDLADLSTSLPMLVSAIRRQINKSAR